MKKSKNYIPGNSTFAQGFLGPRGNVGFLMVVDYNKAKDIITSLIKDNKTVESAELGLDGDWNNNSTEIYKNGKFVEYNANDSSLWAEPILLVKYEDGSTQAYSCWTKEGLH